MRCSALRSTYRILRSSAGSYSSHTSWSWTLCLTKCCPNWFARNCLYLLGIARARNLKLILRNFCQKIKREKNFDLQAFKSTKAKLPLFLDILQNVIKWRKEKSIYPKIGAVNFALSECTKVINSLVIPCWVLGFRFAKKLEEDLNSLSHYT